MSKPLLARDAVAILEAAMYLADAHLHECGRPELPHWMIRGIDQLLCDKQLKYAMIGASDRELDACERITRRLEEYVDDAPNARSLRSLRLRQAREQQAKVASGPPQPGYRLGFFPDPPRKRKGKPVEVACLLFA